MKVSNLLITVVCLSILPSCTLAQDDCRISISRNSWIPFYTHGEPLELWFWTDNADFRIDVKLNARSRETYSFDIGERRKWHTFSLIQDDDSQVRLSVPESGLDLVVEDSLPNSVWVRCKKPVLWTRCNPTFFNDGSEETTDIPEEESAASESATEETDGDVEEEDTEEEVIEEELPEDEVPTDEVPEEEEPIEEIPEDEALIEEVPEEEEVIEEEEIPEELLEEEVPEDETLIEEVPEEEAVEEEVIEEEEIPEELLEEEVLEEEVIEEITEEVPEEDIEEVPEEETENETEELAEEVLEENPEETEEEVPEEMPEDETPTEEVPEEEEAVTEEEIPEDEEEIETEEIEEESYSTEIIISEEEMASDAPILDETSSTSDYSGHWIHDLEVIDPAVTISTTTMEPPTEAPVIIEAEVELEIEDAEPTVHWIHTLEVVDPTESAGVTEHEHDVEPIEIPETESEGEFGIRNNGIETTELEIHEPSHIEVMSNPSVPPSQRIILNKNNDYHHSGMDPTILFYVVIILSMLLAIGLLVIAGLAYFALDTKKKYSHLLEERDWMQSLICPLNLPKIYTYTVPNPNTNATNGRRSNLIARPYVSLDPGVTKTPHEESNC